MTWLYDVRLHSTTWLAHSKLGTGPVIIDQSPAENAPARGPSLHAALCHRGRLEGNPDEPTAVCFTNLNRVVVNGF